MICDMIYLTAIRLPPGGSSTIHIYTQTVQRTTQSTQTIHRTTQFNTYRGVDKSLARPASRYILFDG